MTTETKTKPGPTLLASLPKASEAEEYSNVLWFGQEGTAKTTDLARATQISPKGVVIIINAEGGIKKNALARQGVDTDRLLLWPPPGVPLSYNNLKRFARQCEQQLASEPGSILAVGFDSITEVSVELLGQSVTRGIRRAEERGKPRDGDEFDVEQSDWGVMTSQVVTLLRRFRDLPCHFGATALERSFKAKDGDSDEDQLGPDLNPGLATKVLGFFDLVIRTSANTLTVGPDEYEVLTSGWTRKTTKIRAKDRENVLPTRMPEPTFDRVRAYVTGDLTQDDDPGFAAHEAARQKRLDYQAAKAASTNTTKES